MPQANGPVIDYVRTLNCAASAWNQSAIRRNTEFRHVNRELLFLLLLFFKFGTPRINGRPSSVLSVGGPKTATYRSLRFFDFAVLVASAGTILI